MAGVLYIRDPETGEFVPVPTLVGPPGPGVPAGGAAGQVLVKSGEADHETQWRTLTADDVGAMGNGVTTANLTKIDTYLQVGVGSVTRVGKFVSLTINCSTKASIPQGGQLFTIPEGFRPVSTLTAVSSGTDKTANSLYVTTDGVISNSGNPIAENIWVNMAIMYIAG